jgi:hypothetical protein
MMVQENLGVVSDEEIKAQFTGTNFGREDFRTLLEQGVLKAQCGYHNGHTLSTILKRLDLVDKAGAVTEHGRHFLFGAFYEKNFDSAYGALRAAAIPFVKIIKESEGRIPTENLSLANWHALIKAFNRGL